MVLERILDTAEPDKRHKAGLGRVVAINPTSARLHTGEWAEKTIITVSNPGDVPAYAVAIKMLIDGQGVTSSSVELETDSPDPLVEEGIGGSKISLDQLRLDCSTMDGKQLVLLILHTIHAKAHRSFWIRGTVPISSNAAISIEDLDDKPRELLTKKGQIAHKFKATQNMIINGIAYKMGSRGGAKGPRALTPRLNKKRSFRKRAP